MNGENAPLSWTVDLFFLRQWQETQAHIRYLECTSNAISPPEMLIEVPAVLFPLNFLFIHSLTKTLSSCRISSSTASRPCWLFMSPEEGSWMGGIQMTVEPVSIHFIILPYLQAEHHWAASICSLVNLQEVTDDVRVSLLHALLQFP